jgi:hypothetical protein
VGDSRIQPNIDPNRQKSDVPLLSRSSMRTRLCAGGYRAVHAAILIAGLAASVLGFATEPCDPHYLQEVARGLRPSPRLEAGLVQAPTSSSPVVPPPIGSYAVLITHPGEMIVGTVEEIRGDVGIGIRQGRQPIRIVRPQEIQRLPVVGTVEASGQIRLRIDDGREIGVDRERRPVTIYTQSGEQRAQIRGIFRNRQNGELQIRAEIESGPERGVVRDLAVRELFPPQIGIPATRPSEVVEIPQTRNRDLPTTRPGSLEGGLPPTRPGTTEGEVPAAASEVNGSPVFPLTRVARGGGDAGRAAPLPETVPGSPPEPIPPSQFGQVPSAPEVATLPWIPVGPAVFRSPSFREIGTFRVPRCCQAIQSGPAHQIRFELEGGLHNYRPLASQPTTDIYVTGEALRTVELRTRTPQPPLAGIEYSRPDQLVGGSVPEIVVRVSNQTVEERLAFEEQQQGGRVANETATFTGRGSQSSVYFVHPPLPLAVREQIQAAIQTRTLAVATEIRRAWAQANSRLVMKIRTMNPWNLGTEVASQMLRRDLAIQGLAVQLTGRFRFLGRQLIRVATLSGTPEQLSRGVVFQEAVNGPSAFELQQAVNRILAARQSVNLLSLSMAEQAELTRSFDLLRRAGLKVEEAQLRLQALEQFYRETYTDVMNFSLHNRLRIAGNNNTVGAERPVGFDYLHGNNVIWDRATQQFVMIDW